MTSAIDTTHALPLDQISHDQLSQGVNALPAEYRNYALAGLPIALAGTGQAERLLGRANDVYQLNGQGQQAASAQGTVNLSGPSTAGPHANYSHNVAQTQGTYYVPLENVGKIKTSGKEFDGKHLTECLNKADPERRARFMSKHGIVQTPEGQYMLPVQQSSSGFTAFAPGMTNNPVGLSTYNILNRTSWMAPVVGFVGGGLPGLVGGMVTGAALKSAAGAYSSGGAVAPAFGGGSYLGNIGNVGTYGGLASAAQCLGLNGMAFTLRKQMNAFVADMQDDTMIAMINNRGIPIEDLLFLFMAHMADKYDQRLREKMEETALAEQRERQREQKQDMANMLGGIASLVPGVGTLIGSAIKMGVNEEIRVQDALNGNTKSSTILMQEVQVLMQKWKQINEMLSNLSKSLHDMAMTPIRNLR